MEDSNNKLESSQLTDEDLDQVSGGTVPPKPENKRIGSDA